jgi:hypothetical protein
MKRKERVHEKSLSENIPADFHRNVKLNSSTGNKRQILKVSEGTDIVYKFYLTSAVTGNVNAVREWVSAWINNISGEIN